jgi:hypothetical protein
MKGISLFAALIDRKRGENAKTSRISLSNLLKVNML